MRIKKPVLAASTMFALAVSLSPLARSQEGNAKVQTLQITLTDKGYEPSSFDLKQGIPAHIASVRQAAESCGTEIVIPLYIIKRGLPLNKPVVVEFTPEKAGGIQLYVRDGDAARQDRRAGKVSDDEK